MRLLMIFALLGVTGTAHAESAFVMVPHTEERVAEDVRSNVLKAVEAALRVEGVTVINLEAAKRKGVACEDESCIADALDKLKADFGVHVTMLAAPSTDAVDLLGSVGVAFFQRDLTYRAMSVRVLDRGVERAVDESVRAARAMQRRGPGPWIVVNGTPADAAIFLNGTQIDDGSLPCEAKVTASQPYVIEARRPGFQTREYRTRVGADLASAYDVEVKLEPDAVIAFTKKPPTHGKGEGDVKPQPRERAKTATWKDWTIGAATVTSGVLVSINPLRSLAQSGDCYENDCTRKVEFGARSGVLLALGGGLAITGILVPTVWKPFGRLEVIGDKQTALLRFSGTFGGTP